MALPRALGLVLLSVSACARPVAKAAVPSHATVEKAAGVVSSNVARADYAGSQTCEPCHPTEHEAWARSAMHRMTRVIEGAEVHAPFAGEVFRFKDDRVTLEQRDGQRLVTLDSKEKGRRVFRVTRVIGGRVREDFAGIAVDGARSDERILPVSWVIAERAYRYKGYSVMTPERPGLRPGAPWARTCIFCHNTQPYLDTMLGALAPGSKPYQGEVIDALLPPGRRRRVIVDDARALRGLIDAELRTLQQPPTPEGTPAQWAEHLIRAIRRAFDARQLLEVGIGCESCHGGSKEHALHTGTRPSLAPRTVAFHLEAPADPAAAHAQAVNRTCARCHQVLFSAYPYTWEGGRRSDPTPGGSHISSGEARDFLLGACSSKLACTACHDPHAHDGQTARATLEGARGNELCLGCHAQLRPPEVQRAHAHHDPSGTGGSCIACHMPRKNMSLDMKLGSYHRIGSPTEKARVEKDRPLECALCHADKRVGELVEAMERWWGKRYDRAALRELYGEPSANVMRATLALGKPHEQAVALYVLGRAGARDAAPLIARQLVHPYPILRYYARDALSALLGARPIDLHTDNALIEQEAARWLAAAKMKPLTATVPTPTAKPTSSDGED